ncbi:MAG: cyclic nucleotide-binding domain-containing protein [Gammaproteobacteria bacterium]|nr:cyclic nucleotide-binding domain-containing protein [Gammaproteobacteria bacterium]
MSEINSLENILVNIPLFSNLKEIDDISKLTHIKTYVKNTTVINEGDISDSLYIIISGRAKVFISDEQGKELMLKSLGKGDYFGEMSLLDESPRSASITTLEDSLLATISKSNFIQCMLKHPDIAISLSTELCKRLRLTTENLKDIALTDGYSRIAKTLLQMAEVQNDKKIIARKLTHQNIANMAGTSREMVTRILNDLTQGGYLSIEDKKIIIHKSLPGGW